MNNQFSFYSLDFSHISLITSWFNSPHVQKFYSLRQWTENEVRNKLKPYIVGDQTVKGFIINVSNKPIGYIQYYKVNGYPWPNQNLSQEVINTAAGIDMFIGDDSLIGKGIGGQLVQTFLDSHIWPSYEYCIVDPDINNIPAIRCYEKLNFKEHAIIESKDALNRLVHLKLMIKRRI